jgi:hypothetical protein
MWVAVEHSEQCETEKNFVSSVKFPAEVYWWTRWRRRRGDDHWSGGPTFSLSIMCGIRIFTELSGCVFRIVAIDEYDAVQMIEELAGKKLLEGFRGMKANKQLVIDLLLHVSKLGEELIDQVDQMDLNPVFVYEHRVCVVDAKLILK